VRQKCRETDDFAAFCIYGILFQQVPDRSVYCSVTNKNANRLISVNPDFSLHCFGFSLDSIVTTNE
jgi:hypothetical protein